MKNKIKILFLEDNSLDKELICSMILKEYSECNIFNVITKKDFTQKLKKSNIDLILADYDLPGFDGFTALKISQKINPSIPFIFVTGRISEEMAIDAMKAGATDYVFKDKLGKLIPALKRALKEIDESKNRKEIEKKLIVKNELFRFIIEESTDGITIINQKGVIISWNKAMEKITGINSKDAIGRYIWDIQYHFAPSEIKNELFYKTNKSKIINALNSEKASWLNKTNEIRIVDILGNHKYIEMVTFLIKTVDEIYIVSMMRDITERKKAEELLIIKDNAIESSSNGIVITDLNLNITYANNTTLDMLGYKNKDQILGESSLKYFIFKKDVANIINVLFKKGKWEGEFYIKRIDRKIIELHIFASFVKDRNGKPICIIASFYDITLRKKNERELIEREEKYRSLFEYSNDAIFIHDFNGNILDVNEKACILLGYDKGELLQIKVSELHPKIELEKSNNAYKKTIKDGSIRFYSKFKKADGAVIDVDISSRIVNYDKKIIQGIVRSVTKDN